MDQPLSGENYTLKAWEAFYQAVDDRFFREKDQRIIYEILKNELHPVFFGNYLRRYIYQKAELTEPFDRVADDVYREIIQDEFKDRGVPASFQFTTATVRSLSKNWLTQQCVNRQVVLLLGFGLGMSADDVNNFLTKACQETMLDPKNPQEALCWYCFRNGYRYERYQELWKQYEEMAPGDTAAEKDSPTTLLRSHLMEIRSDGQLLSYLSGLKADGSQSRQGASALKELLLLYDRCRAYMADGMNAAEAEDASLLAARQREKMNRDDRLYEFEKQELVRKAGECRHYEKQNITPADVENILLSAVPKGKTGNLVPMKKSALNAQFQGRRLSRQRLSDLLSGQTPVTRYDLITLSFYVFSQRLDDFSTAVQRYGAFLEETDEMLNRCSMGEMYIANPYENFVLMCMLTDDPLGTYADVWELSYDQEEQ